MFAYSYQNSFRKQLLLKLPRPFSFLDPSKYSFLDHYQIWSLMATLLPDMVSSPCFHKTSLSVFSFFPYNFVLCSLISLPAHIPRFLLLLCLQYSTHALHGFLFDSLKLFALRFYISSTNNSLSKLMVSHYLNK